jgi:hypothetical protein
MEMEGVMGAARGDGLWEGLLAPLRSLKLDTLRFLRDSTKGPVDCRPWAPIVESAFFRRERRCAWPA